jgi:hypothetical protein
MSLATVIRLEFSYPGVGILAGDSLQYLSTATAHGVIMVFYMIMPAIFGAFGNFLLPTQLGVHDVAFPRLNSAAFWFLPGGLIMLCQLVCTDRRYARMNCFNIRELQGVLKRKFFVDLFNSHDHRTLLNTSMLGLKFKLNNNENLSLDTPLFYGWGLLDNNNLRLVNFNAYSATFYTNLTNPTDIYFLQFFQGFFKAPSLNILENLNYFYFKYVMTSFFSFVTYFNFNFLTHSLFSSTFGSTFTTLFNTFSINFLSLNLFYSKYATGTTNVDVSTLTFTSKDIHTNKLELDYNFLEKSDSQRVTRFYNPLINYDYKTGHYLGSWDKLYPQLILSFLEVARGIRKPTWVFSEQYLDLLAENYLSYFHKFTGKVNLKLSTSED